MKQQSNVGCYRPAREQNRGGSRRTFGIEEIPLGTIATDQRKAPPLASLFVVATTIYGDRCNLIKGDVDRVPQNTAVRKTHM